MSDVITDANGRTIDVVRLNKLQLRQFIRRMGSVADVDRWIGEAIIAAHAVGLDGVPLPVPKNPEDADALVARLDNVGLEAIASWLQTQPDTKAIAAEAKN